MIRDSLMTNRPRMTLVFVAAALASACFVESAKPTTFRYECSATADCNEPEVCSDGLCQQPCGPELEACASGTLCLNGFCSSLCPTDENVCPDPQQCVSLSADTEDDSGTGVCTVLCDDTDHPCADGQLCLVGFCATMCMTSDDCNSGEDCTEVGPGLSVCVSSSSGGSGFP